MYPPGRSHIPFQCTVSDSLAVRYVNVSSLEGIYVCVFYVLCRVSPFFVVSIWFSICDDRMFFLEGINAQCHTGETVLMLALKDGQVWVALLSQVLEERLRNVWDTMIGIYK